jgi:pantothenate kinase
MMRPEMLNDRLIGLLRRELSRPVPAGPERSGAKDDLPPIEMAVTVAGLNQTVIVEPDELAQAYLPLIRVLCQAQRSAGRRLLVGLAGIPGSGKSTHAMILAELWRQMEPGPLLAVIAMDGWHLPNTELDRRVSDSSEGVSVPLRRRKGSPPSFDAEALATALRNLRMSRQDVTVPRYDRMAHDPVPDGTRVSAECDLVLIEGNYLLLDDGPWADVSSQMDLTIWLEIEPAACREGIVSRHVTGGMSVQQAEAKYLENDWPNAQIALTSRPRAAWILQATPAHHLVGLSRS